MRTAFFFYYTKKTILNINSYLIYKIHSNKVQGCFVLIKASILARKKKSQNEIRG